MFETGPDLPIVRRHRRRRRHPSPSADAAAVTATAVAGRQFQGRAATVRTSSSRPAPSARSFPKHSDKVSGVMSVCACVSVCVQRSAADSRVRDLRRPWRISVGARSKNQHFRRETCGGCTPGCMVVWGTQKMSGPCPRMCSARTYRKPPEVSVHQSLPVFLAKIFSLQNTLINIKKVMNTSQNNRLGWRNSNSTPFALG